MARSKFPATPEAGPILVPDAGNMTMTAPLTGPHHPHDEPMGHPPANAPWSSNQLIEAGQRVDVEVVVPVFNEERVLAASVQRLHHYLAEDFPLSWVITVADNASTDGTWGEACRLAQELDGVRAVHITQKGRGRALRTVWAASAASVVAYMDVDLSTDLGALLPLVAPLLSGHSDVAIGSRLAQGARVVRGPKREIISRFYNFLLRATLHNSFTDAQCGFKAVRADVARRLLPLVEDNGWFFDTELLVLAERNGLRVHEVAVDWVDDPDSRVEILRTAREDLKGVARMLMGSVRGEGRIATGAAAGLNDRAARSGLSGAAGQVVHFAAVGALSTVSFAVLFALLYSPVGPVAADVIALGLCALGNLMANRRYTFTAGGCAGRRSYYRRGMFIALLPLGGTLAAIGVLSALGWQDLPVDLIVLTGVNLSTTAARFGYLRQAAAGPLR